MDGTRFKSRIIKAGNTTSKARHGSYLPTPPECSRPFPQGRRCLLCVLVPSREVLQVSLLYLRVISACGDGKIRIYNFLNGNCLKVIKVDARGDPVLSFFYQGNRWVVGRCGAQRLESFYVIFVSFSSVTLALPGEHGRRASFQPGRGEQSPVGLTDLCPRLRDQGPGRAVLTLKCVIMPSLEDFL